MLPFRLTDGYEKREKQCQKSANPELCPLNSGKPLSYLPVKLKNMEYGKNTERKRPVCLECGSSIKYGRTDKKFCCDECKDRHHNSKARSGRMIKRRVLSILERNYEVLDDLVKSGIDAVWLSDLLTLGFNPYFATSFLRRQSKEEYTCFDIHYIMTPHRVSSISKIRNLSLNLQAGPDGPDHEMKIERV